MHATIDFETRSPVDIRAYGAWNYSVHPDTQIICLAYMLPGYDEPRIWYSEDAFPNSLELTEPPADLFDFIRAGGLVEAHNSFFEMCIWDNIGRERLGWPAIQRGQWRCSAAKASMYALPRSLEFAAAAMDLDVQKDMDGRRLMLKMCKPLSSKSRKGMYDNTPESLLRLGEYCKRDVVTEHALSSSLPPMPDRETRLWQVTEALNFRGLRFDLDMARKALAMADEYKTRLNAELEAITGLPSATRRSMVKDWLNEHEGLGLENTADATLDHAIGRDDISDRARRVIHILRSVNKTSTSKYAAILDRCDAVDGRARDYMMYHGASTGRWSGKGIQIQNFPSRAVVEADFQAAAEAIKLGDLDWVDAMYGDVMTFLSGALRACIIPEDGEEFAIADYSAIEARVVLWLADDDRALDIFRRNDDIYCDMASSIYGRPITKKDKNERQLGKASILGLGYGMGYITFLLTIRGYGIRLSREEAFAIMGDEVKDHIDFVNRDLGFLPPRDGDDVKATGKRAASNRSRLEKALENPEDVIYELAAMRSIVHKYRNKYASVKNLWSDQYAAAVRAVHKWQQAVKDDNFTDDLNTLSSSDTSATIGPQIQAGKVSWRVENNFLIATLPSGRSLYYRHPRIKMGTTDWGARTVELSYMSVDSMTKKWERTHTYGGKVVENLSQAVARDIMADAIIRLDDLPEYAVTMSVHDEIICAVSAGTGDAKAYEKLLCKIPPWLDGCPIAAEGEIASRYKK